MLRRQNLSRILSSNSVLGKLLDCGIRSWNSTGSELPNIFPLLDCGTRHLTRQANSDIGIQQVNLGIRYTNSGSEFRNRNPTGTDFTRDLGTWPRT